MVSFSAPCYSVRAKCNYIQLMHAFIYLHCFIQVQQRIVPVYSWVAEEPMTASV